MYLKISNKYSSPFKRLKKNTLWKKSRKVRVSKLGPLRSFLNSSTTFFLPNVKTSISLLNAPYRYKLSQTHLGFRKYKFINSVSVLAQAHLSTTGDFVAYCSGVSKAKPVVETNLVSLCSTKLSIKSARSPLLYSI